MNTYTTQQVHDILNIKKKWEAYEHEQWKLISFSPDQARFGWLNRDKQYVKYVTITRAQTDFLVGVPPDVLDKFYA